MRPLAFKLLPWEFLEICQKSLNIVKNLNFATWEKVLSNFIGPPRLNREKSALVFFYWITTDKLEFTDWSEVEQRFGSGEIAIFGQGRPKRPTSHTWKGANKYNWEENKYSYNFMSHIMASLNTLFRHILVENPDAEKKVFLQLCFR